MSVFTSILNLIKPNSTTDASQTFNIDTFLNDNWQKIDDFAAKTMTTDNAVNNLAATQPGFYLDARQGKVIGDRLNVAEGTITNHASQLSELTKYNKIINGDFRVNQRAVSGTVTLTSGKYGHDRWKAGSSGCTYTFFISGGKTTITITSGSLIQVVEGINLQSGNHVLSWEGTSQGKIGAGSYSSSGVISNVTGGTDLNVEFGTGTIANVKLEKGTIATPFVSRLYEEELTLCGRYYEPVALQGLCVTQSSVTRLRLIQPFKFIKRIAPTVTLTAIRDQETALTMNISGITFTTENDKITNSSPLTGFTNGLIYTIYGILDSEL